MAAFDPNSNEITTDAEYLLKNPGYIKQAHDLLVQYGIIPADGSWGSDAATAEEVEKNPYSVAKLLSKGYQTGLGNNMNTANAHGALFSGAYVNNQAHQLDDYQRQLSDASRQLIGGLGDISNARTGTLVDIWNRQSSKPVDPNLAPTNGGLNISGSGTAADPTIVTNPNVPNPTTPAPGPSGNPWNIPGANGVGLTVVKPKPVVGGRGHVT